MPVQLSQETTPAKLICAIFLTPIIVLGLIFLILWLGLRPHAPKFHIQDFSVPDLGQPNGFEIANITFNVTVRNPNRRVRIHYDYMDGSVHYKDQLLGSTPILLNSFNQEPKITTTLQGVLSGTIIISTANNQSWVALINDRAQGTVIFSLQFKSIIKFKRTIWDSRHRRMHANCDVGVGMDGLMLPNFKGKRCAVHLR